MHEHYVIFDKTVTKLVTILTKCVFPYLNPTSYLKLPVKNRYTINVVRRYILKVNYLVNALFYILP